MRFTNWARDSFQESRAIERGEYTMVVRAKDTQDTLPSLEALARETMREIARAATNEYVSRDEAAKILGRHTRTVDNYVRRKFLRPFRIKGSRAVRFRRADVLALFTESKTK
jgi:hypothetical protein